MNLIGNFSNQEQYPTTQDAKGVMGGSYKPRTLTEQLNDKIAYHKSEISKIEEALNALTPDVQKALDALSKL